MKNTIKIKAQHMVFAMASLSISANAAVVIANGDMEINTLGNDSTLYKGVLPTGWVGNGAGSGTGAIGEDFGNVTTDPSGIAWMFLNGVDDAAGTDIGDIASNLGSTINITYTLSPRLNATFEVNHSIHLFDGTSSTWVAGTAFDTFVTTSAAVTSLDDGDAGSYYNGSVNLTLPGSYAGTGTNLWVVVQNADGQLMVDDVSVSSVPIPEPSYTALLGLGGLALILRRSK